MSRQPVTVEITPRSKETLEIMRQAKKKVVAKPLRKLVRDATLYAERRAKFNAPYDTGEAKRAIQSRIEAEQGIVFTTSYHGALMEGDEATGWARQPQPTQMRTSPSGRRYEKQLGMPPVPAIEAWAKRKGLLNKKVKGRNGESYKLTAYLLARSIARRGIKGRFYFREALESTERRVPNLLRQFERDLKDEWRRARV